MVVLTFRSLRIYGSDFAWPCHLFSRPAHMRPYATATWP
jgi:hypothetical protein